MALVHELRDTLARFLAPLLLFVLVALGGCVAYQPAPLAQEPRLAVAVGGQQRGINGRVITLPVLDRLVLRDNPDLVAARGRLGIAEAQVLQAGLLPNPQFTAAYPFYVSGPGGSDGFALGLAQDLRSIILRPAKREAATNAAAAINASLLWQEWQTIGKARLLFVDIAAGERAAKLIARDRKLLQERFDFTNASVRGGGATLANLSPDLVALDDIQKTDDDLARQQLSRRHRLALLLGLAPDEPLRLAAPAAVPRLDPARVRHDAKGLAGRRPDLIALQYGYRSEDAKLRQAVLSQFPNLTVSVFGGRDTSMIYSAGPQVGIELPVFDRGETAIALERATRAELGREFDARLAQATGEVEALASEQALLRRQLDALEPRLRRSREIGLKTETAFKTGAFDERAYIEVEVALLSQEQQKIALEQALLEGQVAMATLTGAGMPSATIAPEPSPADPLGLLHAVMR